MQKQVMSTDITQLLVDQTLLRFIMPYSYYTTVDLVNDPDGYIRQFYTKASPNIISIVEYSIILGIDSIWTQTFSINGQDMVTLFSQEENHKGIVTTYQTRHTYIRLPANSKEPALWEYQLNDHIRVSCKSRIVKHWVKGIGYDVLYVDKKTTDNLLSNTIYFTECYVAELGIQSKLITNFNE